MCCKRLPEIGVHEDWAGKGFQEKRRPGKVLVIKLTTFMIIFIFSQCNLTTLKARVDTNQTVEALEIDKIVDRFMMGKLVT